MFRLGAVVSSIDRESSLLLSDARPRLPFWKRALDVSFTIVAVPCLLPLMAMIAALIKLNSAGPILFRQERVGQFGCRFRLYKFRTMKIGADTAVHESHTSDLIDSNKPMAKLDATDARLIPCGRALRATGLDELPQFINVLRGEMSVVGPRPCIPSEYARYVGRQTGRFETPPGLTGLWQVSGKNRRTFTEMVELDIDYVARRSLWLDLKIIVMTTPALLNEVRDIVGTSNTRTGNGSGDA